MIMEAGAEEPYMGTFFVQVYGPEILLITVVESDWLLDEDRVYPVAIDPSIRVNSAAGGYCYIYYAYCYSSAYRYHYRYYGSYYYVPWHKYTFTSSSALPSGATVDKIEEEVHELRIRLDPNLPGQGLGKLWSRSTLLLQLRFQFMFWLRYQRQLPDLQLRWYRLSKPQGIDRPLAIRSHGQQQRYRLEDREPLQLRNRLCSDLRRCLHHHQRSEQPGHRWCW